MIQLGHQRRPFRLGLTPMIDVVFLLLVFFMLAARFGSEDAVVVSPALGGAAYEGPPRLITIAPDGPKLNGRSVDLDALARALGPLMESTDDTVALRPVDGVALQALVDVMTALNAAGLTSLVIVE